MKEDLGYRLKTYLKNNQVADDSFSLLEEKNIIEKLSVDLKNCTYNVLFRNHKIN